MIPTKDEWNLALIDRHGKDLYEKFSAATVAICGLGGLGSNIAIALTRAGVGKLILIDFDRVDITNLHRQQYKANQIGLYPFDNSWWHLIFSCRNDQRNLTRPQNTDNYPPKDHQALVVG